jgi:hypothetical protein
LGSASLNQGNYNTRKEKVSISIDTFQYLNRQVVDKEGVTIRNGQRSKIVYELKEGLQAFSNKRACVSQAINFEQSTGVWELTKLFGSFTVFGIRQRRPKLADPLRKLETYDGIHYLVEQENRVSASLEYAKGLRQLTVMVAYRHYLVSWLNGVPQGVPTALLKEAIEYHKKQVHIGSANNHSSSDKLLHATFKYEGQLTKVVKGGDGDATTSYECTFVCGARAGEMLDLDRTTI